MTTNNLMEFAKSTFDEFDELKDGSMPTGCIVDALKKMGYEDATEDITWDIE